jgi:hypothetical protein
MTSKNKGVGKIERKTHLSKSKGGAPGKEKADPSLRSG